MCKGMYEGSSSALVSQTHCLSVPVGCRVQGGSYGDVCGGIMKLVTPVYSLASRGVNKIVHSCTVGLNHAGFSLAMLIIDV